MVVCLVNNMDFQRRLAQHQLGVYQRDDDLEFLLQDALHTSKM
jgi:hypothetical protein